MVDGRGLDKIDDEDRGSNGGGWQTWR